MHEDLRINSLLPLSVQANPQINEDTLLLMLTTVRPAGSKSEAAFVKWLFDTVTAMGYAPYSDGAGNVIVDNLPSRGKAPSRVMFTAHTDSVHRLSPTGRQELEWTDDSLRYDQRIVKAKATDEYTPNCLGADDATGCYILLRLLQAGVKGLYVWFREEEVGGVGSDYFRNDPDNREYFRELTHCVSFDRKGYNDVITHQYNGRCASDEFAYYFSNQVGDISKELGEWVDFLPDNTGTFTDSANFADVISECTNISVGYAYQHTPDEEQDLEFVENLCKTLERVDWTGLPYYRREKGIDFDPYLYEYYRGEGLLVGYAQDEPLPDDDEPDDDYPYHHPYNFY